MRFSTAIQNIELLSCISQNQKLRIENNDELSIDSRIFKSFRRYLSNDSRFKVLEVIEESVNTAYKANKNDVNFNLILSVGVSGLIKIKNCYSVDPIINKKLVELIRLISVELP